MTGDKMSLPMAIDTVRMNADNTNGTEQGSCENPLNGHGPPILMTDEDIEVGTRRLHQIPQFTKYGFLFTVYSMVMYIVDTGLDIYVAYAFFTQRHFTYFTLTMIFVLVPAIVTTAFSITLYILDSRDPNIPEPPYGQKIVRWIFSIFQLGPILRDVNVLNYGIKSALALNKGDLQSQQRYFKVMQLEESDAAFLRLFERFLEAAPQVTLQLFVIIHHIHDPLADFDGKWQWISILTSLASLAWSLTSYNNTSRTTSPGKANLTYYGKMFQFLWNICMIYSRYKYRISRVCALAFFASSHPMLIGPICAIHWAVMLVWLTNLGSRNEETDDEDSTCTCDFKNFISVVMNGIFAFVYLFVFLNITDEPTRHKYWIFYVVILVENTVFIFTSIDSVTHSEVLWTMVISYGFFMLGFVFMFIYFKWFHPSLHFSSVDGALKHMINLGPLHSDVINHPNENGDCNEGLQPSRNHSTQYVPN